MLYLLLHQVWLDMNEVRHAACDASNVCLYSGGFCHVMGACIPSILSTCSVPGCAVNFLQAVRLCSTYDCCALLMQASNFCSGTRCELDTNNATKLHRRCLQHPELEMTCEATVLQQHHTAVNQRSCTPPTEATQGLDSICLSTTTGTCLSRLGNAVCLLLISWSSLFFCQHLPAEVAHKFRTKLSLRVS